MEIVALRSDSVRGEEKKVRTWHHELRLAIRDPAQLIAALELPPELLPAARRAAKSFPLFVPWPYLRRIEPGNPADPLLRQVLPLGDELKPQDDFHLDPVGDAAAELAPGVLKKYAGRSLLITTGVCAIHCRYCFRRHYPYSAAPKSPADWQPAIDRLAEDSSIDEAILSGGDPLTLTDRQLSSLVARLARVPHLRRLRIHTRLPIIIPKRVTDELLTMLRGTRLRPIVVIHANHPAELDEATSSALARLIENGVSVLNQSVLLAGVNDDVEALIDLSRRLVDLGVMPYYLHQLDRVVGAAHFEVPLERGVELVSQMRRALPGYAVPRYVQEVAGEAHKRVLA